MSWPPALAARIGLALLAFAFCPFAGAAPAVAEETGACEFRWTAPVPFYQSISWSPDGTRLAFSAVTTNWEEGFGIFVINVDGSGLRRLDTGGQPSLYPVFSPDGRRIAFASRHGENSEIYVVEADGSGMTRLTDHSASDGYPSWSPDGGRIAFHSNRDGNYEIWVMNADGSHPAPVTRHPADDYNPAWSPAGNWIAFESDRDEVEGDELYLVGPDGSGLTRVVDEGVFPAWSPDGSELLFATGGLHAVGVDGSGRRELHPHAVCGAWSPDGSTLAVAATDYDEDCNDHHSLVLLEPDGTPRKKLLPLD